MAEFQIKCPFCNHQFSILEQNARRCSSCGARPIIPEDDQTLLNQQEKVAGWITAMSQGLQLDNTERVPHIGRPNPVKTDQASIPVKPKAELPAWYELDRYSKFRDVYLTVGFISIIVGVSRFSGSASAIVFGVGLMIASIYMGMR